MARTITPEQVNSVRINLYDSKSHIIWQGFGDVYEGRLFDETPAPITPTQVFEESGVIAFEYPDRDDYSNVIIGISHAIIASRPYHLGDHCLPIGDGPWHEYNFNALQLPHYDEDRGDNVARRLEARFIHPVRQELILDRAVVLGRMAAITAGQGLPEINRPTLVYNDRLSCEYTTTDSPDSYFLINAKSEKYLTGYGLYDKKTARSLQENWQEADSNHEAARNVRHDFHVDVSATVKGIGIMMRPFADDLASLALGAWRTLG